MIVSNEKSTVVTKRCVTISQSFIRAMQKHGVALSLLPLVDNPPQNDYEALYGQQEVKYGAEVPLFGTLQVNPPEQFYKDMHLETKGDAVLILMSYSLQTSNLIGDTLLDYQSIPKKLLGNHVRIGTDYYRVDECKQESIYQGFPLQAISVLTFLKTNVGA